MSGKTLVTGVIGSDTHIVGNRIQVAHIDCDHMALLEPENLSALAKLLRGWLVPAPTHSYPLAVALTA